MTGTEQNPGFLIRAACVLVENGRICLVKQEVSQKRQWSLPGGKLEAGETLSGCITREFAEETGLKVKVRELLYMTDRIVADPFSHVVHMSFLVDRQGNEILPPEWQHLDPYPSASSDAIREVRMVPVEDLDKYGFAPVFCRLAVENFPGRGSYKGDYFVYYGD